MKQSPKQVAKNAVNRRRKGYDQEIGHGTGITVHREFEYVKPKDRFVPIKHRVNRDLSRHA